MTKPIKNIERIADWQTRLFVFAGHTLQQERGDMVYPFTQEANFLYLTGIHEPDWMCIVEGGVAHLVAPRRTESQRIFDGELSVEDARAVSGIDSVLTHAQATTLLKECRKKYSSVSSIGPDPHAAHYHASLNPAPVKLWRKLRRDFTDAVDVRRELAALRAIKQSREIKELRHATRLTEEAFLMVKERLDRYGHEYEIEADMTRHFRASGAKGHAYEPIIASGHNACTLHYNKNVAPLPKRGLVLLDVGASWGNANADVTRTYCIGEPTQREREVYGAVLEAQQKIIAIIKPGLTFKEYQQQADRIMREVMAPIGLLESEEGYHRYFPHAVSHGLGIDVHESLGGYDAFREGMVLTVEPGIYIPEEGIGVRIEDDILVVPGGNENLTRHAPYEL